MKISRVWPLASPLEDRKGCYFERKSERVKREHSEIYVLCCKINVQCTQEKKIQSSKLILVRGHSGIFFFPHISFSDVIQSKSWLNIKYKYLFQQKFEQLFICYKRLTLFTRINPSNRHSLLFEILGYFGKIQLHLFLEKNNNAGNVALLWTRRWHALQKTPRVTL